MQFHAIRYLVAISLCGLACPVLLAAEPTDELSVEHIIKKLRENEALYDNIELVFTETYKLHNADMVIDEAVTTGEELVRIVHQGENRYSQLTANKKVADGKDYKLVETLVSDGKSSRVLSEVNGKHSGTIRLDAGVVRRSIRSHLLLMYRQAGFHFVNEPLSKILESKLLSLGFQSASPTSITVEEAKYEKLDDLACIKLTCKTLLTSTRRPDKPTESILTLWLAKDRNYLPVRMVYVRPKEHATLPALTSAASDMREVAPGIWFPSRVKHEVFTAEGLRKGESIKAYERIHEFKKIDPKPQYDAEFFRDLPFPKGTRVVVVSERKVVMKYVEGGEEAPKDVDPSKDNEKK